jgi:hypothetical protein
MATRKGPARSAQPDGPGSAKKATPAEAGKSVAKKATQPGAEPVPQDASYVGDLPDDTPNEHYTLPGVIADKPVPEHDKPGR